MMPDPLSSETRAATDLDADLAACLQEAYDVPPVPATLLRRLDRTIAVEWGEPLPASFVQRAWKFGGGWLSAVPVAACAALVALGLVLFSRSAPAYAWAAMIEALERQDLVQLDSPGLTRWLSLAEGVVGERKGQTVWLFDARQNVILERDAREDRIRRRRAADVAAASHRDQLVLAFLAGPSSLPAGRILGEEWDRVEHDGRNVIALRVQFETASQPLSLTLRLDPATQLPQACEVRGSEVPASMMALSYPAGRAVDRRARDFPAALPVVDVAERESASATVAADAPASATPASAPAAVAPTVDSADAPRHDTAAPLSGAAAHWPPVKAAPVSREELLRDIDAHLTALWKQHGIEPAPPADDEELLRRAYLDLAGRTPTVHEARTYLNDPSPQRYEQLVDRLLNGPDHASHVAVLWRTALIPDGIDLTAFGGVEAFDRWLTERLARHEPYDQIVRHLLLAEGRLSRSGPLLFYSAAKLDPDQLASRTARVFLGMRLECAQCHNHPFEPWTQQDFWSLAAFFARISRPQGELLAASTVMQVRDIDRGDVKLPDSNTIVAPRFLDGRGVPDGDANQSRRLQLARWLTSPENPYFARAAANRVWGLLFGKGIVDPVDDFGAQHPPKSPEILDLLAGQFLQSGFDLRELFRTAALSRAYRLSSGAPTADEARAEWFAQMHVKTLTAEQVYDCIAVAALLDSAPAGNAEAFNVNRFGNAARAEFLQQFRTPGGRSTEYLAGIPQALTLMNGTLIDGATGLSSSGLLKSLEAPFFTNDQRIEVLYLATLSRRPRSAERELLRQYIRPETTGAELQEGLSDLLWALLNSAEFTMNH